MRFLRVVNFDKWQHYKNRNPPWIKLYNGLLDNYEFAQLPDATKWHFIASTLLASRSNNKIPDDAAWVARMIGATEPVDIDALVSAGFLDRYDDASKTLAVRKQVAMPEGETEQRRGETETEGDVWHTVWQAYPKRAGGNSRAAALKAFAARVRAGVPQEELLDGVRRYALYIRATGRENTEYVKQASTFFGPSEHWKEPWTIPAGKGEQRANGNRAMLERFAEND